MQKTLAMAQRVADSDATLLIRGESGTGKTMLARDIHSWSRRSAKNFGVVSCPSLSMELLESELFGHVKGAFTGALRDHLGRIAACDGGTLFLDEIGDISTGFQTRLLRVLQEREFERVGGSKTLSVDVRLIAATNRNLEDAVANHQFRADLYYRINVVSIFLPPLRERREDIPLLAEHFLQQANKENGKHLKFSQEAMQCMCACNWPGNVRELTNCVERINVMTTGNVIRKNDMLCDSDMCFSPLMWRQQSAPQSGQAETPMKHDQAAAQVSGDPQKHQLIDALEKCGWVQAKAARLLGLSARQMGYAIAKHEIDMKRY